VYGVHQVEITYKSGARTRIARADVCYFAYPPALEPEITGPVVRAHQACVPES
jgi:hypothetical protein